MGLFAVIYVLSLVWVIHVNAQENTFDVVNYGATGSGYTDDTSAFVKAWNDTCNTEGSPTMIIPKGKTFFVQPITFLGPCKSNDISISLSGNIFAPYGPDEWKAQDEDLSKWLVFQDVTGLTINGPGSIDGRGKPWWDVACRDHPGNGCHDLSPTALRFNDCKHVRMNNIYFYNSSQTHILVLGCQDVNFTRLNVNSPESSPNTDGIHIQRSDSVYIHVAQISTGDDCISIGDYTTNVVITDINCGPGHGISIGSLGRGGNEVQVENITVKRVNFYGTTNGARIKTWQVGKGKVQHVQFTNLNFTAVENPIIIDQHYCDVANSCEETDTGVHISDVTYNGAVGTSNTQVAVNLNCSSPVPCTNITLANIQLTSTTNGEQVTSSCANVYGVSEGTVEPKSCLQG